MNTDPNEEELMPDFVKVHASLYAHATRNRQWKNLFLGISLCIALSPFLYAGTQEQIVVQNNVGTIEVEAIAPNIVRVYIQPQGVHSSRTIVMDPAFHPQIVRTARRKGNTLELPAMSVVVTDELSPSVRIKDAEGGTLVSFSNLLEHSAAGELEISHDEHENLYGMRGISRTVKDSASILRNSGATVAMGSQGDGGAPFFFTTRYGVLIDSDGGVFATDSHALHFTHSSRKDIEFFVITGKPMQVLSGLAALTGHAPMPPRWTLGFLNSQYGSTEEELRGIAAAYREKNIPLSAYILDFDWKAWGEDDYGEWRWNSTSGAGNATPNKFPNGASGKFASDLLEQGIHVAGILKPRILVNGIDGKPTKASAYATEHNFWYPNEVRSNDYYTHRLAGDLDFANADSRKWFWEHLIPSFKTGMTGWWNDEADKEGGFTFNNFQFLNMGRALYEGQRSMSDERVWSINRAYYLGALRYGFALWSGDIPTGFPSMAFQRVRMVSALDIGEPLWSMDTGGFMGHPSSENYARWVEFSTFVPIDRVHGGHNEKRQPWVYGPVAESAAQRAIRLRYDLLPYIYSNQRACTDTGIGIVRPLFWVFPDDPQSVSETRSWMFGDALLVSPIVNPGEKQHNFYLPPGEWFDYWSGKSVAGGTGMHIPVDADTWGDIPIYVRSGSILVTQPAETGNDLNPSVPLMLDVFPSQTRVAKFSVYDDDGHTYTYEKGAFFQQDITATQSGREVILEVSPARGKYKTSIPRYIVRIHSAFHRIQGDSLRRFANLSAFNASSAPGWIITQDRFGSVALVRLLPGGDTRLTLQSD